MNVQSNVIGKKPFYACLRQFFLTYVKTAEAQSEIWNPFAEYVLTQQTLNLAVYTDG